MSLQTRTVGAQAQDAIVCAECGTEGAWQLLQRVRRRPARRHARHARRDRRVKMRRSFPAVYLGIPRAPVRTTVGLAEDPSYRSHVSFLLSGIAVFCLLMIPDPSCTPRSRP